MRYFLHERKSEGSFSTVGSKVLRDEIIAQFGLIWPRIFGELVASDSFFSFISGRWSQAVATFFQGERSNCAWPSRRMRSAMHTHVRISAQAKLSKGAWRSDNLKWWTLTLHGVSHIPCRCPEITLLVVYLLRSDIVMGWHSRKSLPPLSVPTTFEILNYHNSHIRTCSQFAIRK